MNYSSNVFIKYFKVLKFLRNYNSEFFFFFPFWQFGGGEIVHANILEAIKDKNPICFITHLSANNYFQKHFEASANVIELEQWGVQSSLKRIMIKKIARKINRKEKAIVFGCNSTLLYKLLPLLKDHVEVIDLIHAFSGEGEGMEEYSLSVVERINKRIVLGRKTYNDFAILYEKRGVPQDYMDRIKIITNQVLVPEVYQRKEKLEFLNVLFVARNSLEKRFEIVLAIAERCFEKKLPVIFNVIGDFEQYTHNVPENVKILGTIKERSVMNNHYKKASILLITSSREGFPMTIMEGMSYGVVPIATAVGEIPYTIDSDKFQNGFVIENVNNKDSIAQEFTKVIEKLCYDRTLLGTFSKQAYSFAKTMFSSEKFRKNYRALFEIKNDFVS